MVKEEALKEKERKKIWDVIWSKILPDDRCPYDIIAEDYNNDTDSYLRVMIKWHRVSLYGG